MTTRKKYSKELKLETVSRVKEQNYNPSDVRSS